MPLDWPTDVAELRRFVDTFPAPAPFGGRFSIVLMR